MKERVPVKVKCMYRNGRVVEREAMLPVPTGCACSPCRRRGWWHGGRIINTTGRRRRRSEEDMEADAEDMEDMEELSDE